MTSGPPSSHRRLVVRTAFRIVLCNLAFLVALAGVVAASMSTGAEVYVAGGLPAAFAAWVLVQGGVWARRRAAVIACAALSIALLVLQLAILVAFAWWNAGFGNTGGKTEALVFILWVVVGSAFAVGGFLRAKLPRARNARPP